jgi:hypothetical protein
MTPRRARREGESRRMPFDTFELLLAAMVEEIPPEFLRELQGVHAIREAKPEPDYVDVWRMGEYLDPGPEQFLGSGEGLGRHVALYYGSFVKIAEADPDFDWEDEMWETLTHELRHHVESLAGDESLIADDVERARDFQRRDD